MVELAIVRHGDAAMISGPDSERPLTERGQAQAAALAAWLDEQNWRPQQLIVSPYLRAQMTARPLRDRWASVETSQSSLLTPDSDPRELLSLVESSGCERLLLIGHNPLLSTLLNDLVDPAAPLVMGTASLAIIRMEVVASGCGRLQEFRHYPDYQYNLRN